MLVQEHNLIIRNLDDDTFFYISNFSKATQQILKVDIILNNLKERG